MSKLTDALDTASRYQIASQTGAIGASAATKIIFYAQNTSTSKLALIEQVKVTGLIATTAFAVGQIYFELYVARGFSAEAGTPHGTALTITGANQRLWTPYDTTALGVIRIADTTAAGITAGTWTLDAQPIGNLNTHSSAGTGAATPIIGSQYIPNDGVLFNANVASGEFPVVLDQNEGVVLQVTVPGTGVCIAGVQMKWAETKIAL